MPQEQRRAPAVHKTVENINSDEDIRVRIIGTVIEANADSVMVDDGSGATEVFLDADDLESVKDGQRVGVIGRVLPTPESFEIQGEIVQDMSELNMELYNKVKNISPYL